MPSTNIDKLTFIFFKKFSWAEYALKKEGYLKDSRNAQPDWEAFSERNRNIKADGNIQYFLSSPPKKTN